MLCIRHVCIYLASLLSRPPSSFLLLAVQTHNAQPNPNIITQDLLQLQYEGLSIMKMFGRMKINVDSLIELLNDKFYA